MHRRCQSLMRKAPPSTDSEGDKEEERVIIVKKEKRRYESEQYEQEGDGEAEENGLSDEGDEDEGDDSELDLLYGPPIPDHALQPIEEIDYEPDAAGHHPARHSMRVMSPSDPEPSTSTHHGRGTRRNLSASPLPRTTKRKRSPSPLPRTTKCKKRSKKAKSSSPALSDGGNDEDPNASAPHKSKTNRKPAARDYDPQTAGLLNYTLSLFRSAVVCDDPWPNPNAVIPLVQSAWATTTDTFPDAVWDPAADIHGVVSSLLFLT